MLQELIEQHVSWNEEIGEWQLVSITGSLHHAPYVPYHLGKLFSLFTILNITLLTFGL